MNLLDMLVSLLPFSTSFLRCLLSYGCIPKEMK